MSSGAGEAAQSPPADDGPAGRQTPVTAETPLDQSPTAASATAAPAQPHTSPLLSSSELPQDVFHGSTELSSQPLESDHTPPSRPSEQPPHAPTLTQPQPQGVQDVAEDPQETIIRSPVRVQTTSPHETPAQGSSTPSPTVRHPPRPILPASGSNTSVQSPTHVRILPETSLTRSPAPQAHAQPWPGSTLSHDGHVASDSEVDLDHDPRRSYYRRNQPLPPLPGRMASIGGPSSSGHAGLPTSGPHGQETAGNTRDDARHASVVPVLGTATSHATIERSSRTLKPASGIDWVVPSVEEKTRERTLGERLEPTLYTARIEAEKYASKAKVTGYSLNIAIGLQVVLGAMTTGLSVVTTGKQTSIMTAILGGLATIVASFLARSRGTHEPELSIGRLKDLEHFIRECEAFKMDYGHLYGSASPQQAAKVENFRDEFEELLGNGSGEKKMTPPA